MNDFTIPTPDKTAILAALAVLFTPDDVIELRAFAKGGKKRTDAGYFDAAHWPDLADHAVRLSQGGMAVYVTLNPVDPQLLGRYNNRMEQYATATTTDKQVTRRRWLLIDLDPVRPTNTSATNEQLESARLKAGSIYLHLKAKGWALPVVAKSGNGYHLLYGIDLPNDDDATALLKSVLMALAEQFDDAHIKVDRSVFNAARICKLYGTVANKGDPTESAPWRLSSLVQTPVRDIVTVEQLRSLYPQPTAAIPKAVTLRTLGSFNLEDFLARHGLDYQVDQHDGRERFKLATCPFNAEHVQGQAAILREPAGKLGFRCMHDSCTGKDWKAVRELLDGPRPARIHSGKWENDAIEDIATNAGGTGATGQNDAPFSTVQQTEYDTLKSAVMAIPKSARLPDSKHDAQTTIGFALSSEYGKTHRGQAAVIAREWDAKTGGRAFDVFTRADPDYADKGGDPVTKNSIYKLARANGWTDTAKGQPDDDQDLHRNTPKPSPDCLYGLVCEIAKAGSENTEANVYAVGMSAVAYLGAAIGRGPYLSIGDDWHHTNGFFLHIGRSARGRKGTAKKLIKRIAKAVKTINESLAPQIHTGGLSSREGWVFLIHDGITQGTVTIPAIDDKRLLVIESEFANVLHQSKRDGNTLSPAIRDSWDGTSIKPATKTSRTWATHPHISLMGDITPTELLSLMKSQDFTNGFANRFLMIFAEGDKVNPFPKKTPNDTIDNFARHIQGILEFSRANFHTEKDTIEMQFSGDASKGYAALYRGELRDRSSGERISALLDRRVPVLLRLAMLFALTDLSTTIEVHHINAALAWVRYWTESVKFVFQSAMDEEGATVVSELAEKILTYLAEKEQATRKELTRDCFAGHASKERIDQALDELLTSAPPKIEVETLPRAKGATGTATKIYRIRANCANYSEILINQHVTCEPFCEPLRTDANHYANSDEKNGETGTVRKGSQQFAKEFAYQTIDFVDKSNGSHSSQIFQEKEAFATDDVEVF